jgi:hypothetical protein
MGNSRKIMQQQQQQQPLRAQQSQQIQPQQQSHYDLSKEIMTIKAQLLAAVNRLDYVEKNL